MPPQTGMWAVCLLVLPHIVSSVCLLCSCGGVWLLVLPQPCYVAGCSPHCIWGCMAMQQPWLLYSQRHPGVAVVWSCSTNAATFCVRSATTTVAYGPLCADVLAARTKYWSLSLPPCGLCTPFSCPFPCTLQCVSCGWQSHVPQREGVVAVTWPSCGHATA